MVLVLVLVSLFRIQYSALEKLSRILLQMLQSDWLRCSLFVRQ